MNKSRRGFLKAAGLLTAGVFSERLLSAPAAGESGKKSPKPQPPYQLEVIERSPEVKARPNILYVFSDQQRRQACGFMGQDQVFTPNLDAFAAQGTHLTNALASCPLCAPYRTMLFTGRHPLSTGITTNDCGNVRPDEVSLARAFNAAGYDTTLVGKWHLCDGISPAGQFVPPEYRLGFKNWHGANANHDVFWQLYYEDSPSPVVDRFGYQPEHDAEQTCHYLKTRDPSKPFAIFMASVPPHNGTVGGKSGMPAQEPHYPNEKFTKGDYASTLVYHAPEQYEAPYRALGENLKRLPNVEDNLHRYHCDGYFGGVTGMDDAFGKVLKCLAEEGLAENTIVVYSSDHGDMMGSHNLISKCAPYEESVGIPFVVRWPSKIRAGASSDLLMAGVDVAPTLLGLCGAEIPSGMEGYDFSGNLLGTKTGGPSSQLMYMFSRPDEISAGMGKTDSGWRAVRDDRYTYILANDYHAGLLGGTRTMFDNKLDPYQLKPIHFGGGQNDKMKALESELHRWLVQTQDPWSKFTG